jgi:hypothetical protein
MTRNCLITLSIILFVAAVSPLQAGTINAASCSQSNVQAAINQAAQGDTVVIPAGSCAWTASVTWNAPPDVVLQGAGNNSLGGGDLTIITDNSTNAASLLQINTSSLGKFRMTGITFKGGIGTVKWGGIISITGQSKQVRIDHVHINMQSFSPLHNGPGISFMGWVYGVVDHIIVDLTGVGNGITFWNESFGGGQEGDGAFAAATDLGTDKFLYVEDSTFNGDSKYGTSNDCTHGGRYVWRHNTMNRASVQTHPTGGANRARGCRAWEVYLNTYTGDANDPEFNTGFFSAGTGVIWGNSAPAGYSNFLSFHSMRKNNSTYGQVSTPNGWGYCGTAFNGVGSNFDGNTDASSGYPCIDQPGRGVGDLLSGAFPNATNMTTGCTVSSPCVWPRQALEPIYEWMNVWACQSCGGSKVTVYEPTVLAANRDYYLETPSFTGATGTGSGLLSNRPGSCTINVAYWGTDTNTLYKCSAPNTWTAFYTPYSYPHPLTIGGGGAGNDTTPPSVSLTLQ